jgi:hypothetical protein
MANEREAYFLEQARLARANAEKAGDPAAKAAWLTISEKYEVLAELAVNNRD